MRVRELPASSPTAYIGFSGIRWIPYSFAVMRSSSRRSKVLARGNRCSISWK
jgi:hypothetical protein